MWQRGEGGGGCKICDITIRCRQLLWQCDRGGGGVNKCQICVTSLMNDPLYLSPIFFSFVLLLCCSQWVHDIWSPAQLLKSYFVREGKLGCFDLSSCFFSSSKMAALFFASSNGDFPELFLMLMLQPRFKRTFTMSKLPLETLKFN